MLEAVIFDMDGVIIDSEPIHLQLNKNLFEKLGLSISEQEYNTFVGASCSKMWFYLKNKYHLEQAVSELVKNQADNFIQYLKKELVRPMPGILSLLMCLKQEKIKIGLASSSSRKVIISVLEELKIRDYFYGIVSGEEMVKGKPAPDIFLKAADILCIKPAHCVVIEDSKNGVTAAKAAKMKCVGLQNPNSGKQDLSKVNLLVKSLLNVELADLKKLW